MEAWLLFGWMWNNASVVGSWLLSASTSFNVSMKVVFCRDSVLIQKGCEILNMLLERSDKWVGQDLLLDDSRLYSSIYFVFE